MFMFWYFKANMAEKKLAISFFGEFRYLHFNFCFKDSGYPKLSNFFAVTVSVRKIK